jgi:hypothetical protein
MTTIVTLEPWEYEWACSIGIRRFTANWNKKDASHYKAELMEDNRTAQVAACIAELAVAKAINHYWSGHVWSGTEHSKYKSVPDVGTNIEVRRVRKGTTAAVRKHQLGMGLKLFVAYPQPPEFRVCEIWGWMDYDEAWQLGTPSSYAPDTTRLIERSKLFVLPC